MDVSRRAMNLKVIGRFLYSITQNSHQSCLELIENHARLRIRKENNRMLVRCGRFYMLKLGEEQAASTCRNFDIRRKEKCSSKQRLSFR